MAAAKPPEKKAPSYTVARFERADASTPAESPLAPGDKLVVIETGVQANTQELACDLVVDRLPVKEREGEIGAFLVRGTKSYEYETEQTVVTRKKRTAEAVRPVQMPEQGTLEPVSG